MRYFSPLFWSPALLFFAGCGASEPQQTIQPSPSEYEEVPVPEEVISEEFPRPDVAAKYPGGPSVLNRTIQLQTIIPEPARRDGYAGRALITYIVDENGVAGEAEAVMSPHESITEMYRAIIDGLERWQPALIDGEPVAQKYMFMALFRDRNAESDRDR